MVPRVKLLVCEARKDVNKSRVSTFHKNSCFFQVNPPKVSTRKQNVFFLAYNSIVSGVHA